MSLFISKITSYENLQILAQVIDCWDTRATLKQGCSLCCCREEKWKVFRDMGYILRFLQLEFIDVLYQRCRSDSDDDKGRAIYAAYDENNRVQGLAVVAATVAKNNIAEASIQYLVTNPDNVSVTRKYGQIRGVGTALLGHAVANLEEKDPGIPIVLHCLDSAENFYTNHGFTRVINGDSDSDDERDMMSLPVFGRESLIQKASQSATMVLREPVLDGSHESHCTKMTAAEIGTGALNLFSAILSPITRMIQVATAVTQAISTLRFAIPTYGRI